MRGVIEWCPMEQEVLSLPITVFNKEKYWLLKSVIPINNSFQGFLLDKAIRGDTPLKEVITFKNPDSIISYLKTDSFEAVKNWLNFIEKTYA